MLNIITHQGEANQNQMKKEHPYEIILIPTRWLTSKQELVLVRTCSEVGGGMQNGAGALEESGSTNGIILTSRACVAPYRLGFIQRACGRLVLFPCNMMP